MTAKRLIVGSLRALCALLLTGVLGYALFFAFVMVVCTGGGALVIIVPIAIVVLPIYFGLMRYSITGSFHSKKHKKRNDHEGQGNTDPRISPQEQYVIDMRRRGSSDEEIISNLLGSGWQRQDIEEALRKGSVTSTPGV